jgi:hypothetical protein
MDTRRLRQSSCTPWRRVGSEVILAPPGREDFDVLSDSGAIVWELLEEPSTEAELVNTLASLYGVGEEQIAGDVNALLSTLLQSGAIEAAETSHDSSRR